MGWLDLSRVAIPATDVVPQLIGAMLFGAGFAIASLCPGTACVSAATGKRDGVVTIVGLFVGTLIVSLLWTQLGPIAQLAPHDHATLSGDLDISAGVVVAGITVIALLAIAIADRITGGRAPFRLSRLATVAPETRSADVTPRDLAEWIRARAPHLRILDIRENLAPDDYRIPGAEEKHARDLAFLTSNDSTTLVIYGDGTEDALPVLRSLSLRRFPKVLVLRGGIAAWDAEIMAPRVPDARDSGAVARFESMRELSAWFGGRPTRDTTTHPRPKRAC